MEKVNCDVLVVGGGVAGCAAAIVAARRGNRVVLIEKENSLGGLATNGYVTGIAGHVEGICEEWFERVHAKGWGHRSAHGGEHCSYNPEKAKLMLEQMIIERNGRILYGVYATDVDGKIIRQLMIEDGVPLNEPPSGHCAKMRNMESEFVVDLSDSVHIIDQNGRYQR